MVECSNQIEQNIVKLINLKFSCFVGDHVEPTCASQEHSN